MHTYIHVCILAWSTIISVAFCKEKNCRHWEHEQFGIVLRNCEPRNEWEILEKDYVQLVLVSRPLKLLHALKRQGAIISRRGHSNVYHSSW